MISLAWNKLKTWKKAALGPVTLVFKFERTVRITQPGTLRAYGDVAALPRLDPAPTALPLARRARPPSQTAVLVGAGPGLGHGVARVLAAQGFDVVMVSRDGARLDALALELNKLGQRATAYGADATHEGDVKALFEKVIERHGVPSLVIYAVQGFGPGKAIDVSVPAFEDSWRKNCLGAFLVGTEAARRMKGHGRGSIFFVGSTSSLVGREDHLNLAVGKFGQRALAQVLARELWPSGIHVAHVVIDADIMEDAQTHCGVTQAQPEHIGQAILALHLQPSSAWTSEMDLRPARERFWEHC